MPTVLCEGPYKFMFYSTDLREPAHIHVKRERRSAKFWLEPISLAKSHGFAAHELNDIEKRVVIHRQLFLEAWREHFNA